MNGAPLEETNLTGGWLRDYIFFNGQRIAARTPTAGLLGFFANHLGSTSKLESVSSTGAVTLDYDADYYPFGRAHQFADSYDPAFKFTGKERDEETGLDNFGARYHSSNIGRFMSPDWDARPVSVPYASLRNPQSLNLYAYVVDNPITVVDPNGHILLCQPGGTCPTAIKQDLNKIAPGTTVDSHGTVHKAGLLHRAWNHLSGHGEGQALVTSLVDSKSTTTINAGPSGAAQETGTKSGATISFDPGIDILVPTNTGGGQVSDQPVDPAVVLAHEMIHAYHDVTGTSATGMSTHVFSANGGLYHEIWYTEQFNTVGFGNARGPTENEIRQELGEETRASYLYENSWIPGP